MKNTLNILILFILCVSACKETLNIPPDPVDPVLEDTFQLNPAVEMGWTKRFDNLFRARSALIAGDLIVFVGYNKFQDYTHNDVVAFNKYTGDTAWVLEDYKYIRELQYGAGNIYFLEGYGRSEKPTISAINAQTGQTQWAWDDAESRTLTSLVFLDGMLYTSANYGTNYDTKIIRLDPANGQATEEYTFLTAERDNYILLLASPTPWHHPNGDLIMFYDALAYRDNYPTLPAYAHTIEYIAVNLTADSIYFNMGNYFNASTDGTSSPLGKGSPTIKGNFIYFNGRPNNGTSDWKTGCVNMLTREIMWTNSIPPHLSSSRVKNTQIGSVLIGVGDEEPNVNAINAVTGVSIWNNQQAGKSTTGITEYMGMGWFNGTKGIIALDPSNGNIVYRIDIFSLYREIWEKKKKGQTSADFCTMIIDRETGYFYTMSDGIYPLDHENYFTCFKIKE